MDCHETQERLDMLLDGRLDADEARAVRQHLDSCPACRQEWEALHSVRAALRTYPQITASPEFDQNVLSAVLSHAPRPHSLADVVDTILARPVYYLLTSCALGILVACLALGGLGLLGPQFRPFGQPSAPPAAQRHPRELLDAFPLFAYADWMREFQDFDPAPHKPKPPSKGKPSWDANSSSLSPWPRSGSSC